MGNFMRLSKPTMKLVYTTSICTLLVATSVIGTSDIDCAEQNTRAQCWKAGRAKVNGKWSRGPGACKWSYSLNSCKATSGVKPTSGPLDSCPSYTKRSDCSADNRCAWHFKEKCLDKLSFYRTFELPKRCAKFSDTCKSVGGNCRPLDDPSGPQKECKYDSDCPHSRCMHAPDGYKWRHPTGFCPDQKCDSSKLRLTERLLKRCKNCGEDGSCIDYFDLTNCNQPQFCD